MKGKSSMKINKLSKFLIIFAVVLFIAIGFLSYHSVIQTKKIGQLKNWISREIVIIDDIFNK
jgi:amino acid permease